LWVVSDNGEPWDFSVSQPVALPSIPKFNAELYFTFRDGSICETKFQVRICTTMNKDTGQCEPYGATINPDIPAGECLTSGDLGGVSFVYDDNFYPGQVLNFCALSANKTGHANATCVEKVIGWASALDVVVVSSSGRAVEKVIIDWMLEDYPDVGGQLTTDGEGKVHIQVYSENVAAKNKKLRILVNATLVDDGIWHVFENNEIVITEYTAKVISLFTYSGQMVKLIDTTVLTLTGRVFIDDYPLCPSPNVYVCVQDLGDPDNDYDLFTFISGINSKFGSATLAYKAYEDDVEGTKYEQYGSLPDECVAIDSTDGTWTFQVNHGANVKVVAMNTGHIFQVKDGIGLERSMRTLYPDGSLYVLRDLSTDVDGLDFRETTIHWLSIYTELSNCTNFEPFIGANTVLYKLTYRTFSVLRQLRYIRVLVLTAFLLSTTPSKSPTLQSTSSPPYKNTSTASTKTQPSSLSPTKPNTTSPTLTTRNPPSLLKSTKTTEPR